MATQITVLLLGGFELVLGPGVFTVFDLHKMDVPLFWKELTRVTDLGSRWSGCGWRWVLPVFPAPPCTGNWSSSLFSLEQLRLQKRKEKERKDYASKVWLRALRKGQNLAYLFKLPEQVGPAISPFPKLPGQGAFLLRHDSNKTVLSKESSLERA
eukprot:1158220-Pelagomonas_calceolata.AAC.9